MFYGKKKWLKNDAFYGLFIGFDGFFGWLNDSVNRFASGLSLDDGWSIG